MQTPGPQPYQAGPVQSPPRRTNWVPWLAGCGGCGCLAVIAVIVLMVTAFRTPKAPPPVAYVGQWQSADGRTFLDLASDGSAAYRTSAPGSNSNITGGGAKVDEAARTLAISLGPFHKTWHIDEPPHDAGGAMEMTLDGVAYRKAGFTPGTPSSSAPPVTAPDAAQPSGGIASAGAGVPTDAEVKQLTTVTLLLFDQCVKAGDFTAMEALGSTAFQQQLPPDKLKSTFQQFIDKHVSISGIQTAEQVLEPAPQVDAKGVLLAQGYYTTTPRVSYKLGYIKEGGTWKLVDLSVHVGQ